MLDERKAPRSLAGPQARLDQLDGHIKMTTLPSNLPDELIARRQWVIWRYIQRRGKDRPDKVPHSTMGYRADVTNPATWSAFELALKAAERPHFAEGIGFVFSSNDPYSGIDMDNSWQSNADEGAP